MPSYVSVSRYAPGGATQVFVPAGAYSFAEPSPPTHRTEPLGAPTGWLNTSCSTPTRLHPAPKSLRERSTTMRLPDAVAS